MLKLMLASSLLLAAALVALSLESPLASPDRENAALFELHGRDNRPPQGSEAPVWLTGARTVNAVPCLPMPFRDHGTAPLPPLRGG